VVYCITMKGEGEDYVFYGDDSVNEFINKIDKMSTKINYKKARPKEEIEQIYIYGFNNARFDNLFIYKKLYERNPSTEYVFAGNSIKYIKYNNINICDICMLYNNGGLRKTAKDFNIVKEKGVFPYKFVNKNNLNYKGLIPDKKYWNTENDFREYQNKEGINFNMKDYTIKYCLLDSEITYLLAKKHIEMCVSQINDRNYNVIDCMTSAKLSVALFQQTFQEDEIKQSPNHIIDKERRAYKGGRTEVFKKYHKKGKLYHYDINSAHPSGMCELMPYKYYKTIKHNDIKTNVKMLVNTNLYKAKVEYKGGNKLFIPNILIRTDKNDIIAVKNSDYDYHWGNELKEAILNGCDVYINEEIKYETKDIFREYIQYLYAERRKAKAVGNSALSLFYKNCMNGLYGKLGQRQYGKTAICHDVKEMFKIIKGDANILKTFEVFEDIIMFEYKTVGDEYSSIGQLVRFSSYIAATTRCKLSAIMRDIGNQHIYYVDTDSIFTTKKPSAEFIDNVILGKWKLEDIALEATFLAPKFYSYKSEEAFKEINITNWNKNDIEDYVEHGYYEKKPEKKSKGIRGEDIKYEDYNKLLNNEIVNIAQERDMFFRSFNGVKIEKITREVTTVFNKRKWIDNDSEAFNTIEEWKDYKILIKELA
ncbi:MAG TPA: DNA polymerase, partial [Candidatus Sulfopaludibacter sp.]|nr:DNA polymerase [Candidatus Sulfopaludibacter sp.]